MDDALTHLWQQVQRLNRDDLQRLHNLLEILLASNQEVDQDEQANLKLLVDGIVDHVPWRRTGHKSIENWQPVLIEGKPLSETIIEERR